MRNEKINTDSYFTNLNHNPLGAELNWQNARFGDFDEDVINPKKHEMADLALFTPDQLPNKTLGKRKDIARRINAFHHAVQKASSLQNLLDDSRKAYITYLWTDHNNETHIEFVGQNTIDRIVFSAKNIIEQVATDGYPKLAERALGRYGIQLKGGEKI
ncbi:MAG: hypothetical protein KBC00_03165 [Candidatus Levybacteria bacterium]|nr:hypothetical protein [Candidatus Levybacteria bacterium]MBP9815487.1 hypothetical protein [Candidatus Levybacteria bacterium]